MFDENNFKCPVCRKFMPEGEHKIDIIEDMTKIYLAIFPINDELINCQCNDCGNVYVFKHSIGYYYCHLCKCFNLEEKDGVCSLDDYHKS